ncbi:Asp-tRNA(Asn)/Glu-tRNA(Gln) amidotransferase subunit GatC [Desulfogranum mediterraneum]|uniref:Asp-tRNA(Asn)/Glu-tRNA(Gln) amidotransferase subunit GatC n=1 Tax=Desulfogranum mediterraneum TaxID=160661 RepID=UPI00040F220C|nr:Asp-tRNA(Asn)/Glu-tRNA(Gln) amidotransferase subunit GatC [Desulfogranum mediterraneum]
MKITPEEVERVAALARLQLDGPEVERMTRQLDTILSYVAKLDEIDTQGVEVTTHTQQVVNAFREDEVQPSLQPEQALANAPEDNGASFSVPRIIR